MKVLRVATVTAAVAMFVDWLCSRIIDCIEPDR